NRWYDMGYRTLGEIPRSATTDRQWLGLQLYNDLNQKIPRSEIVRADMMLHRCLDQYGIQFIIAGSYRRGRPYSGDIDILVVDNPAIPNVMGTVLSCPLFKYRMAEGDKKFMGVGLIDNMYRRIDVELVPPSEYPFALLYFTGPGSFNIK